MRTEPNQTSCRASDNIKSTYLIDEVDDCLYFADLPRLDTIDEHAFFQ